VRIGHAQTCSPEIVSFQSMSSTMAFWKSLTFAIAVGQSPELPASSNGAKQLGSPVNFTLKTG
jgi:hypothetical protein